MTVVHVLAVTATIVLITVYANNASLSPGPTEINALLITSKVYEILIIASLSDILLYRIRSRMQSPHGVPLGFLTSPFQLTSVPYLFSRQFRKTSAASCSRDNRGDHMLRAFIIYVVILALATGPSASIVMLPRLNWWPLPEPGPNAGGRSSGMANLVLVNATMASLYPSLISLAWLNASSPQDQLSCPSAAASQIINNLPQVLSSDDVKESLFNYTIGDRDHTREINLGWQFGDSGVAADEALVYATSTLDVVSRDLHFRGNKFWQQLHLPVKIVLNPTWFSIEWKNRGSPRLKPDDPHDVNNVQYMSSAASQWKQPAVAVHCAQGMNNGNSVQASFSLDGPFSPPLGPLKTFSLPYPSTWTPANQAMLSFIDFSGQRMIPPVNASAAFVSQSAIANSTIICLAAARWAAAEIWISKPTENSAKSNFAVDPPAVSKGFSDLSDRISMPVDWANSLNTAETSTNATAAEGAGAFDRLHDLCEKHKPTRCLAVGFSLYLTDALSRYHHSLDIYNCTGNLGDFSRRLKCMATGGPRESDSLVDQRTTEIDPMDIEQYTGITVLYSSYRYGFGIPGVMESIPWVVLQLHLMLVVAYLAERCIRGRRAGGTVAGDDWSDVGELVAVAFRVKMPGASVPREAAPTETATHTHGERRTRDTWRMRAFMHVDRVDGRPSEIILRPLDNTRERK
ncbi:hypothetical protein B0T22DRAFT_475538 [Podospora appendiculata]|uniref:Uncharacterized protein n=1 Tax=Podospora appendiculata TaxID=314037 RepID=A0AAE0XFU1_9PEZI|nr:hypothetical protein B0T22DRAFT_475538 [Podospora appendiculata]